jgi:hypothetical protein
MNNMKSLFFMLTIGCAAAQAASFSTVHGGKSVTPRSFISTACREWVEVRSNGAEEIALWDNTLRLEPGTRVIVGTNSVYFYALCLDGKFTIGREKAAAGKIAVWGHYGEGGSAPLIYTFSAARLAETLAAMRGGRRDESLAAMAETQKRRQWWGLLTPTNFNVAMPVPKVLDDARRAYQTRPEIIAIKRKSRNNEEYAQNTALAFGDALRRRDVELVAALLAPSLFTRGRATYDMAQLAPQRRAFANNILSQANYASLNPGTVQHHGGGVYSFKYGAATLALALTADDDGLFISQFQVNR